VTTLISVMRIEDKGRFWHPINKKRQYSINSFLIMISHLKIKE
jgi:hypothetical protein